MSAKPIRKPYVQPASSSQIDQGRREEHRAPEFNREIVKALAIFIGPTLLILVLLALLATFAAIAR